MAGVSFQGSGPGFPSCDANDDWIGAAPASSWAASSIIQKSSWRWSKTVHKEEISHPASSHQSLGVQYTLTKWGHYCLTKNITSSCTSSPRRKYKSQANRAISVLQDSKTPFDFLIDYLVQAEFFPWLPVHFCSSINSLSRLRDNFKKHFNTKTDTEEPLARCLNQSRSVPGSCKCWK